MVKVLLPGPAFQFDPVTTAQQTARQRVGLDEPFRMLADRRRGGGNRFRLEPDSEPHIPATDLGAEVGHPAHERRIPALAPVAQRLKPSGVDHEGLAAEPFGRIKLAAETFRLEHRHLVQPGVVNHRVVPVRRRQLVQRIAVEQRAAGGDVAARQLLNQNLRRRQRRAGAKFVLEVLVRLAEFRIHVGFIIGKPLLVKTHHPVALGQDMKGQRRGVVAAAKSGERHAALGGPPPTRGQPEHATGKIAPRPLIFLAPAAVLAVDLVIPGRQRQPGQKAPDGQTFPAQILHRIAAAGDPAIRIAAPDGVQFDALFTVADGENDFAGPGLNSDTAPVPSFQPRPAERQQKQPRRLRFAGAHRIISDPRQRQRCAVKHEFHGPQLIFLRHHFPPELFMMAAQSRPDPTMPPGLRFTGDGGGQSILVLLTLGQRLRPRLVLSLPGEAVAEREHDSGQDAADMSHVSHAAAGGDSRHDELKNNPDAEHAPGRERPPAAAGHEHREPASGPDQKGEPHPGKAESVAGDNPGDEAAGADARQIRTGIEQRVQQQRAQARGQQQPDVFPMPEFILHIVAENHQKIEIADQMQYPAVKEHGGDGGQSAVARPLRRNEAPAVDGRAQVRQRQREYRQTQNRDAPGDDRLPVAIRRVDLHRHAEQCGQIFPALARAILVGIGIPERRIQPRFVDGDLPHGQHFFRLLRQGRGGARMKRRNPFQFTGVEPDQLTEAAEIELDRDAGERQRHPPHRFFAAGADGAGFGIPVSGGLPQHIDEIAVAAEAPQTGDGQHPAAAMRAPEIDPFFIKLLSKLITADRTLHSL
ncbi:hypothetical protein SDC9_82107 [bioreactor metagenome]|uniref:Uncharacterized protein n=1 Tax=bioreactor metagenome TaxID=1076179 RepID=A0A644ZCA2_9ZZZZ